MTVTLDSDTRFHAACAAGAEWGPTVKACLDRLGPVAGCNLGFLYLTDGLAEHASRVFDALQRSNVVVDVKSAAPVRRELQEGGTALDHFTISARVPPPKAPSLAQPAASNAKAGKASGAGASR